MQALRKPQHVNRADDARLGCLDGVVLVMYRRGGAGEVIDLVDLDIEREGDVVPDGLKSGVAEQRFDVAAHACEIVVDTENRAILVEQAGA